jgi:uncharacterized protein YndB with AHSA1/START domain
MTILRAGLFVLGSLVALVALIAIVGLLLPRNHVETRSATVAAPPERVFAIVTNVADYPRWRRSLSAIEVQPPVDGRLRWVEVSGGDRLPLEIVERDAPRRVVTRITDPALPFGGTWTFELAPDGQGTRVTITERGEIRNPIFRALARFVFGYATTMETWLADLATTSTTGA